MKTYDKSWEEVCAEVWSGIESSKTGMASAVQAVKRLAKGEDFQLLIVDVGVYGGYEGCYECGGGGGSGLNVWFSIVEAPFEQTMRFEGCVRSLCHWGAGQGHLPSFWVPQVSTSVRSQYAIDGKSQDVVDGRLEDLELLESEALSVFIRNIWGAAATVEDAQDQVVGNVQLFYGLFGRNNPIPGRSPEEIRQTVTDIARQSPKWKLLIHRALKSIKPNVWQTEQISEALKAIEEMQ